MDRKEHWERVYNERGPAEVSWHQEDPRLSLSLVEQAGLERESPILDAGGGSSRLVDHLRARGFSDVTVLDLSRRAMDYARERLGDDAERIDWIEGDVTALDLERHFALWHDRAVFHFLTEPAERAAYRSALNRAVPEGGYAIVATFAPDGPEKCSGLPVVRYSPEGLAEELGEEWELVATAGEMHVTPGGKEQSFVGCLFQRVG